MFVIKCYGVVWYLEIGIFIIWVLVKVLGVWERLIVFIYYGVSFKVWIL